MRLEIVPEGAFAELRLRQEGPAVGVLSARGWDHYLPRLLAVTRGWDPGEDDWS